MIIFVMFKRFTKRAKNTKLFVSPYFAKDSSK